MRAGELRHRITLRQNRPTRDEFNAEVDHWHDVATVWARIETVSGNEYIAQQAAGAALTHKLTLRDRSDVDPAMIVTWQDRRLEIHAVLKDGRRRQMMLMCSEVV